MQTLTDHMARKREEVRAKVAGHAHLAPRCEACGYAPCQCLCPGCATCGGSGYVHTNPGARPGERGFGEVEPCPNYRSRMILRRIADGEMIGGLRADEVQGLTWEAIKPGYSDGEKAREAVRRALKHGSGLVLLYGSYGQAKTLAMKIVVAVALREGKRAAYANLSAVLDDIRLAYDQDENKTGALLDRMERWLALDVLALDELDKVNETAWARARIHRLLDERYVQAVREESLTVVAANFSNLENDLVGYLRSRIEDNRWMERGWVVKLDGPDGRKVMPVGYRY